MSMEMEIPEGYPDNCTDQDLSEMIKKARHEIATRGNYKTETAMSAYAGLMTAGIIEKQNRLVDKSLRTSKKYTKIAISIASLSVLISIVLGILSFRSSCRWQDEQIPLLQEISNKTPDTQQK